MKKTILLVLVLALGVVTEQVKADFIFGTPTNLGPTVNSSSWDYCPSISADGMELFFTSQRPGGQGLADIYVATRATTEDDWSDPVNLGPTVNSSSTDGGPSLPADGLSLYFYSWRPGGQGLVDIWVTTRTTTEDEWGPPVNLGPPVNSSGDEHFPSISADGLSLYFSEWDVFRPGGSGDSDLWVTTRATTNDDWSEPVNLGPTVNSSDWEGRPNISADGLTLFFDHGVGLWVTTRATISDPWSPAVRLGPTVNSSGTEWAPNISADGSTLYFASDRPGGFGDYDIWQATITPIVDFNGDRFIDAADMCIMIDHWGENYSLCDIGPTPLGDGVVDVQDLIVLAKHFLPVFAAHWKLDETEGSIAYDSAGNHHATLNGNPVWQPAEGKIDGALAFNGVDDYVSTPFVLDAANGPCSAFAWIKGAMPGQVIISQADGSGFGGTWFGLYSSDGKLFTTLMFVELKSESVIPDDDWHHLGLVWDGSHRYLYLDGAEIAKDATALSYALSCNGNLYFGVDKDLSTSSFWSGLIDDVRIYNKVLTIEEIEALAR